MILTNALRATFVNAVLADIKTRIDDDLVRKFVTDEAVKALPPTVRALYDDPDTQPYVSMAMVQFSSLARSRPRPANEQRYRDRNINAPSVCVPGPRDYAPSAKTKERVLALQRESEAMLDAKEDMKDRLTHMASTCRTLAALAELLPHLKRYMPVPPPPAMTYAVPAVQVEDMMQELKKLGVPAKRKAVSA